jgi:hypothetical protein
MSSIDIMIDRDLASLGEDSRRDAVAIDDALRTTTMYRDDRLGAEARRDALADERRRELVMMPLTLSHVFAHRVGRAAAGAAALACSALLVVMILDPLLFRLAAWIVPGLDLGMLGALAATAILAVYVIATFIAEAWFARRMRAAIQTGDDPYRDIDALARGPVEQAQQAVGRVDGLAVGLPLAGFVSLALVFGYVAVISSALLQFPYAWTMVGIVHTSALAKNVGILVLALVGVGALAVALARACRRPDARLLGVAGRGWVLALGIVAGGLTAMFYFPVLSALHNRGVLPTMNARFVLGLMATASLVALASWALLWWRRRELARME